MEAQPTPRGAWTITALLFLFMLVNFADKVVVGLAAVPIMDELGLSPTQFGRLGSAFFLLFSVSAVAVGFVVNRVPARWVILGIGGGLGAGAVSDAGHGRLCHDRPLPCPAWRGRRAGGVGGASRHVQVVS